LQLSPAVPKCLEGAADVIVQLLADGGQSDTAALAGDQRLAERFFQQAQLTADGAVSDVQLLGGAAHAAQPGSGLEGAQGVEGRQVAHGYVSFSNGWWRSYRFFGRAIRAIFRISQRPSGGRQPQEF
jgi:hypothetical protein